MSGTVEYIDYTTVNRADYLAFLRLYVGIDEAFLPDTSPWIDLSLDIAVAKVNQAFTAFPPIYVLAVYNYAADRLVNMAIDQPGKTYFADLRKQLGLNNPSPGIIQSSSDQGTSQSFMIPAWMEDMTLTNLQMLKTPWGRAYLGYAQEYGPTIWGLTV
jgi:hypothetical protein